MINIIIIIVLLGLVGWVCQLIAKIARPLGKVILALLKVALIAGAIALVAFLVWKFGLLLWNRRATMLKVLVVIGIILAALVVIYLLYACVMRVRAHKFVKWLARNGIGESREAPGDQAVWNWVNNRVHLHLVWAENKKVFVLWKAGPWYLSEKTQKQGWKGKAPYLGDQSKTLKRSLQSSR